MSSQIPLRKIGNTDVPAIGFGMMGLSVWYGAVQSDEERLKVLDAAYESGCRFWDTADIYGDSEELIGKWFKLNPGKRDQIFLATKFGARLDGPSRGTPEYVKQQCQESLRKMGVDYIDLYYQHRVDASTPIEKTVGAMAELVKYALFPFVIHTSTTSNHPLPPSRAGKVKYLGLSECTPTGLRRASSIHPISALQIEFSALERPPAELLKTARELGTKIIAYSPLGRGFLTGQIRSLTDVQDSDGDFDLRTVLPKVIAEGNFEKIMQLADVIKRVGDKHEHRATAGQAALAWVLEQGEDLFVIPGTKKVKYLLENAGAARVHLTPGDVEEITKAAEATDLPGDRYPSNGLQEALYVESPPLEESA
ncbi:hypothetical protein V5O48_010388 [Marasmius crinis-equi]|uniref:NADP-dependent oxidoreductase domain-containing protein n=1 Tax=Marasmius crinis-equi TaxID=585013 RepID=A0ABR3F8J3_9AGAR